MTDTETRTPADVLRVANEPDVEWAVWHPGDGTQYRVKIVPIVGGPDHADRVLLVSAAGTVVAVRFTPSGIGADYRAIPWTAARFSRDRLSPPGSYDWWPQVIKPLLQHLGAAS